MNYQVTKITVARRPLFQEVQRKRILQLVQQRFYLSKKKKKKPTKKQKTTQKPKKL